MTEEALPVSRRGIELRFLAILTATALAIAAAGFSMAYRIAVDARSVHLVELARAQARLMEAVAMYDAFFQEGELAGASRATSRFPCPRAWTRTSARRCGGPSRGNPG